MLPRLFILVFGALAGLLALAFLARFAMQWARASFRNPVGQFIIAATDWAVLPARKLVPGLFGVDLASLLLAWLTQALYVGGAISVTGLYDNAAGTILGVALLAGFIEILRLLIYLAQGVVIVSAVLSWVNPYSPIAPLFNQLSEPLLRPFRRLIPLLGGVDLSPIATLLLLQVTLMVLDEARLAFWPFLI
jgi:YggT family protein